ncbi:MAG: DNA polymerase III subunit gamma/tau [Candidatus Vogelbacteria bacterium]
MCLIKIRPRFVRLRQLADGELAGSLFFRYTNAMSELALYRKYRPSGFAEVVGQEPIVQVLTGSIKQGIVAHAYLFAGARGTGKTSVARILARELGTSPHDLYEIDAASSRGIDDIRELREAVRTLPFESKYKVYIIDEVHMLSKDAFNALLKTLEEPPSHVIFILATTEVHKLPETIISRCQQFIFRQPGLDELRTVLAHAAKKEKRQLESAALDLIALLGDGSYRDGLGVLQKCFGATADKLITGDLVASVTGAPARELVAQFIEGLIKPDGALGLTVIRKLTELHRDPRVFLKLTLNTIRYAMFLKFAPTVGKELIAPLTDSERKFIETLAERKESVSLSLILRELLMTYDEIGHSYIPELPLELAVLRIVGLLTKHV